MIHGYQPNDKVSQNQSHPHHLVQWEYWEKEQVEVGEQRGKGEVQAGQNLIKEVREKIMCVFCPDLWMPGITELKCVKASTRK